MRAGIMFRTLGASGVLAVVMSGAFVVLLVSVQNMRDSAELSRHSQSVLSVANRLERLVIDLETGERGFLITGDEPFLEPWRSARRTIPRVSEQLQGLTQVPAQHRRAQRIDAAVRSYIRDYSEPLVNARLRDKRAIPAARAVIQGKGRIDAIRAHFHDLVGAEQRLAKTRQDRAVDAARRVAVASAVGIAGSILLVLFFAGYLARAILRPVRRAATMADRLAHGDLTVRMPETGPGEVGGLERSFNTMARSLEQSRDDLRVIAEEQAALRRVATLVAHRASPSQVFEAVASEVANLLGAPSTRLMRYEADGTVTVVAGRSAPGVEIPVGTNLSIEGQNLAALVHRSGRAARMDSFEGASGPVAAWLRDLGIRCGVGAPIAVEGRLWGVMVAAWTEQQPLEDAEVRMAQFTDLVATAIANAESRAELAASRARIVTAGDEIRRRIERDLHDGTQQRLVSLEFELRAAEEAVPRELSELKRQLAQLITRLRGAIAELQEITRGIHPAILSQGGLKPALRSLARRSGLVVELDVRIERRLPPPVEVAAYYVVSEALTNAAKHAQASIVRVEAVDENGAVRLLVRDNGVGGADPRGGSGLTGLRDRVEALGGKLEVDSPAGGGTSLAATIPIAGGYATVDGGVQETASRPVARS